MSITKVYHFKNEISSYLYLSIQLLLFCTISANAQPVLENSTDVRDGSDNTSLTINVPSGTVANELLIAAVSVDGNVSFGTPTGWTLLNQGQSNSSPIYLSCFFIE